GDRTGVLGDLGLLRSDDVHDHAAFERLRHATFHPRGAGLCLDDGAGLGIRHGKAFHTETGNWTDGSSVCRTWPAERAIARLFQQATFRSSPADTAVRHSLDAYGTPIRPCVFRRCVETSEAPVH